MLQHYGRHKQSDLDQIAEACEQVRQKKDEVAQKAAHFSPVSMQDDMAFTVEYTASNTPPGVAQKAAQYVAANGENDGNGAETPFLSNVHHVLENKEHEDNKRQELVTRAKPLNYQSGGQGIRFCSCKSLQEQGLEQSLECAGTKCGTLCESLIETPEIQELFDIATGWSSLPPNIRVAIVLLVQQHLQ